MADQHDADCRCWDCTQDGPPLVAAGHLVCVHPDVLKTADALAAAGEHVVANVSHDGRCAFRACDCGAVEKLKPALSEWHRQRRAYLAARGPHA